MQSPKKKKKKKRKKQRGTLHTATISPSFTHTAHPMTATAICKPHARTLANLAHALTRTRRERKGERDRKRERAKPSASAKKNTHTYGEMQRCERESARVET